MESATTSVSSSSRSRMVTRLSYQTTGWNMEILGKLNALMSFIPLGSTDTSKNTKMEVSIELIGMEEKLSWPWLMIHLFRGSIPSIPTICVYGVLVPATSSTSRVSTLGTTSMLLESAKELSTLLVYYIPMTLHREEKSSDSNSSTSSAVPPSAM